MAKHIGIVACSAEGAALCYRTICAEAPAVMGRHSHPEITMHTHPLSEYMKYIDPGDWEGVAKLMLSSAEKVAKCGADFIICPDNTIHQAFDLVVEKSPPIRAARLPWLHIAQEVAKVAREKGCRCVGILGTRYLMEGPVYPDQFSALGIEHQIPEPDQRARINQIIFEELVNARFTERSRSYFAQVIGELKDRHCDAVVLGCTEIPLLISDQDSPLSTLDSTRLLARAALKTATS